MEVVTIRQHPPLALLPVLRVVAVMATAVVVTVGDHGDSGNGGSSDSVGNEAATTSGGGSTSTDSAQLPGVVLAEVATGMVGGARRPHH